MALRNLSLACVVLLFPTLVHAQVAAAPFDTLLFRALTWRSIGPNDAGRSVAVAGSVARPNEYYAGTTGGGVLKTTDGGRRWSPVTDAWFGGTIGAIAVSESNPDVVYVGGGETAIRNNVSHGDGVWKTTDGGKTWSFLGLADTRHISRIRVHPRNPDLVYVGALGHVFGPNAERGVFRSRDGGKSWQRILFRNDSTGITDLIIDPNNPNTIYAAFWQAGREPWQLVSGGAGSGILKSTDGGDTWTELTRNPGLPATVIGNIGLAVSPAKPDRVWVIIEADSGGVFRSDDGGATWQYLTADRELRQRAFYYTRIYADPKDSSTVYTLNVAPWKSTDGGRRFRRFEGGGDNHDLWIAPDNPDRYIVAHDHGVMITTDGGETSTELTYATNQYYHIHTTNHFPYHVCGAQQDGGSDCVWSRGGAHDDSYPAAAGEAGYVSSRRGQPDITYGGTFGGSLFRRDRRTGISENISPWPVLSTGHPARDLKYRFAWSFPIIVSSHDDDVLYVGANVLMKSTNEGRSWKIISLDLTRHDPATLGDSGGPITKDQTSAEYYGTISTIAESPFSSGVIWVGSDDGLIHLSVDGGASWKNVTPRGVPKRLRMSIIEASRFSAGTAYLAANHYQMDDFQPYLYKTTDFGRSWTRIDVGIPRGEYTRVIREDEVRKGLLFAGSERTVYVSFDDGASWQSLKRNLPPVPVHDLAVKDGDLVAATHGRGFWILDDVSPLRELTPEIARQAAHLFRPNIQYRSSAYGSARVYFYVDRADRDVTLEFLDAAGTVIRSFSSREDSAAMKAARNARDAHGNDDPIRSFHLWRRRPAPRVPNRAGLNGFTWDLRLPEPSGFEGMVGHPLGPRVPPGVYQVRLTVAGSAPMTQRWTLKPDPLFDATPADYAEQFALATKLRDKVTAANAAVLTIRNVQHQLQQRQSKMAQNNAFMLQAQALHDSLSLVDSQIRQVKTGAHEDSFHYPAGLNEQIASLLLFVDRDGRMPAQARAAYDDLIPKLDSRLARLKRILDALLPDLNASLGSAGVASIVPVAAEPEDSNH